MNIKSVLTAVTASLTTLAFTSPSFAANWIYIGNIATGESLYVDRDSIYGRSDGIGFSYRLDAEIINAVAYCSSNEWYAEGYGVYSPQSKATQDMLNYVCQ
jgi:hypothetical protein